VNLANGQGGETAADCWGGLGEAEQEGVRGLHLKAAAVVRLVPLRGGEPKQRNALSHSPQIRRRSNARFNAAARPRRRVHRAPTECLAAHDRVARDG
jgi:hypothetical protein